VYFTHRCMIGIETSRTAEVASVPSGKHKRHRRQRTRSDRFVSGKARIRTVHAVEMGRAIGANAYYMCGFDE